MKLVVIIPAHNEGRVIGGVIRAIPKRLPKVGQPMPLVVDDGSTDRTAAIARRGGALVVRHVLNRGKGIAVSTGLQAARLLSASVVVTMDADGQHDPMEIPAIVAPVLKGEADIVIGSRLLARNGRMPLGRLVANRFSNIFTRLLSGAIVTDSQSGYRAFSKRAFQELRLASRGFDVETEVIAQARKRGLQITEVPIKTIYTKYSRSKGQGFAHGIAMSFRLVLAMLRGYR